MVEVRCRWTGQPPEVIQRRIASTFPCIKENLHQLADFAGLQGTSRGSTWSRFCCQQFNQAGRTSRGPCHSPASVNETLFHLHSAKLKSLYNLMYLLELFSYKKNPETRLRTSFIWSTTQYKYMPWNFCFVGSSDRYDSHMRVGCQRQQFTSGLVECLASSRQGPLQIPRIRV